MTATKKILLATLIVAAGYGSATLFGPPAKAIVRNWQQTGAVNDVPSAAMPADSAGGSVASAHWALDSARLIPDSAPPLAEQSSAGKQLAPIELQPTRPNRALAEIADAGAAEEIASVAPVESSFAGPPRPRASLRNEAPRPLASEPHSPVTVKDIAPIPPAARADEFDPPSAPSHAASGIRSAGFAGEATSPAAARSAHYQSPYDAPPRGEAITPPSALPEESREPRRHIIIDGDSLARLAGRYLDDPHRSEEIFELNRHVLSDPELLPIGVEIAIPPRDRQAGRSGASPQSNLLRGSAIHAAARGLVPVRPVPASSGAPPRAHLARPRPVE